MARDLKPNGWMMTYSGIKFDIFKPKVANVNIEDIAHSLSMLCRFNGTCRKFYSVAQHSVLVSNIINPKWAGEGLLHDATETYVGDTIRPIKIWLPDFNKFEEKVDRVIAKLFGLCRTKQCVKEIKRADNIALITEARDLVPSKDCLCEYCPDVEPLKQTIKPWGIEKSKREFLKRFYELFSDAGVQYISFEPIKLVNFEWKKVNRKVAWKKI